MRTSTIKRIFASKLQAQVSLAAEQLIQMATETNWEAMWPSIQRALIGLSTAAIMTAKWHALSIGLTGLANKIATYVMNEDIDVRGNIQDQSWSAFSTQATPFTRLPYQSWSASTPDTQSIKARSLEESLKKATDDLGQRYVEYKNSPPPKKDRCKKLAEMEGVQDWIRENAIDRKSVG